MRSDVRIAAWAFGAACLCGLIFAFAGLGASSFWLDELSTAWVVGSDGDIGAFIGRALTDVHPPIYYALVFLYAQVAGTSDIALRLFSAVMACAAIVVFIAGTRRTFSLNARLFAAALAVGSEFWVQQSQNARDYSLCLLIGAAILALALRFVSPDPARKAPGRAALAGLVALMVFGSFVHFYLMYEALAVCVVIFLLSKKHRIAMAAVAVFLVVVTEGYVHFVVKTYAQYSTTEGWIRNDLAWYAGRLRHAAHAAVSVLASCALAICGLALALRVRGILSAGASAVSRDGPAPTWPRWLDPVMVLCLGVPVIILGGAVASSILLSPNFTDRNMLVCAPFLWGAMARLYDLGVTLSAKPIRRPANYALSVIVLLTAGIAFNRGLPRAEPFRETSNWIRAIPACRGQQIPVLIFDRRVWANPAFTERLHVDAYGRYLGDFARPRIIFMEDLAAGRLPADLRSELQRRVDGQGCPVLAWSARDLFEPGPVISRNLLASIGRPQAAGSLREQTFRVYKVGLIRRLTPPQGRILYLDRQDVR